MYISQISQYPDFDLSEEESEEERMKGSWDHGLYSTSKWKCKKTLSKRKQLADKTGHVFHFPHDDIYSLSDLYIFSERLPDILPKRTPREGWDPLETSQDQQTIEQHKAKDKLLWLPSIDKYKSFKKNKLLQRKNDYFNFAFPPITETKPKGLKKNNSKLSLPVLGNKAKQTTKPSRVNPKWTRNNFRTFTQNEFPADRNGSLIQFKYSEYLTEKKKPKR